MGWVTVRAIGTEPAARRGPGVTPTLYHEMSLLRNSLLQNMREEAPVNKSPNAKNRGALRRSLRASPWQTDGKVWRSEFTANEYVKFVINRTEPHVIKPKQEGGVLAFPWAGKAGLSAKLLPISYLTPPGAIAGKLGRRGGPSIFAAPPGHGELKGGVMFLRIVHHPGTAANDFVERALTKTMTEGTPGFTSRMQQAIADELIQLITVPAA